MFYFRFHRYILFLSFGCYFYLNYHTISINRSMSSSRIIFDFCQITFSMSGHSRKISLSHCPLTPLLIPIFMNAVSSVTLNSKPKKKLGRPTLYKPEYCEKIQEMGAQGCSLHQISARLGISLQCFAEWREKHKAFGEAVSRARDLAQAWWEDKAMQGMGTREFNAKVWELSVRCRFPDTYRESSRVELSGSVTVFGVKEDDIARAQAVLLQSQVAGAGSSSSADQK